MEGLIPVNSEPNYTTAKLTEASLFFSSEAATIREAWLLVT